MRSFAHLLVATLTALVSLLCGPSALAASAVHLRLEGVINPVKARYVARGLERARSAHASFVLLSINTPGGLVSSMEEITSHLTNDPLPVVGFVEPATAEATSAGAFILLATDVAAMVPDTRVGAAHPVGDGKPLEGAIEEKATNSLVALAKSLATRHRRPERLAEAIVRESRSYTAQEAKKEGAVELLVEDRAALLRALDGYSVETPNKQVRLSTVGLEVVELPMSFSERVLDRLSDPTLASIFLTLGMLGILFELKSPGGGVAGVVGVTSLLLALLALSTLPVKAAGIALFALGLVAIAFELKAQAHGAVALGGLVALVLGALVLVDTGDYLGGFHRTSLVVFGPIAAIVAATFVTFASIAARAMRAPARTGLETLPGSSGDVREALRPDEGAYRGLVFIDGSLWRATANESIGQGEPIIVEEVLGHPTRLRVRRARSGET